MDITVRYEKTQKIHGYVSQLGALVKLGEDKPGAPAPTRLLVPEEHSFTELVFKNVTAEEKVEIENAYGNLHPSIPVEVIAKGELPVLEAPPEDVIVPASGDIAEHKYDPLNPADREWLDANTKSAKKRK